MGVPWTQAELSQFVASGEEVAFFDGRGTEIAPPDSLADACAGPTVPLWDGALSSVHAPERPRLLSLHHAAATAPGRVQQVEFHALQDGVWHLLRAQMVNLVDQPEVGATVRVIDVLGDPLFFDGTTGRVARDEKLWVRMRCDVDGTILEVDGTVEALFGLKPDDLVGLRTIDLIHPDDLHVTVEGRNAAYADPGRETTHHLRICRPDGAVVPITYRSTFTPEHDEFHFYVRDAGQAMHEELTAAMTASQLRCYYQPIVDSGTGRVLGGEALLRWIHPDKGLVPPGDFIPLAEATDAIVEVGTWVLHEACREAVTWPAHLHVAVNLSVRQLADRAIVETVATALESSGLAPARLVLEVTESAVMDDADRALSHLRAIADLGVKLAVDDFGTGYSSLQYLTRMPVEKLKIDRSFVAGLGRNKHDTTIVTSVIALAHALDLWVVAEGVETDAQRQQLVAMGCDSAQGFLWSRPVPVDQFRTLMGHDPAPATALSL